MLAHQDRLLDLSLLDATLLVQCMDALSVLCGDHLLILHLVDLFRHFLGVALFQFHDLGSPFTGFLDLFAGLHLLLFEEGDTICKQLCVTLHTRHKDDTSQTAFQRRQLQSRYTATIFKCAVSILRVSLLTLIVLFSQ